MISGNTLAGIEIDGVDNTTVIGNFIGTDATGTISTGFANGGNAIAITNGSSTTVIGGAAPGAGNVIASDDGGITASGIFVNASNVVIQGNHIGVDVTGTTALVIDNDAIKIPNETNVTVTDNIIGNAKDDAIEISNGSNITVQGNIIGTDATRTLDFGVGSNSIEIDTNPTNVIIGGSGFGQGNVIYNSGNRGITIDDAGTVVTVQGNDFDASGTEHLRVFGGANASQAAPILAAFPDSNRTETTIKGTLSSTANETFVLDFYARTLGDTVMYIGTTTIRTDATGNATFTAIMPVGVQSGQFVMATATNSSGGTSEFSGFVSIAAVLGNSNPVAVVDAYAVAKNTTLSVDWWDTDWSKRQKLTFNNSAQPEDLDGFPVLVKLVDGVNVNLGDFMANGEDLRFIDADGTSLAYEIESWNVSGESNVWVRVPRIDASSSIDSIWMYYGNGVAVDGQNAEELWSADYRGVYHLNENPGAGGTLGDSTANNFDGTNAGSTDVAGVVGNAQDFSGAGQWINLGTDRAFVNAASAVTLSAWINLDSLPGSSQLVSISVNNGGAGSWSSRVALVQEGSELQLTTRAADDDSDTALLRTTTSPLSTGVWS